MSRTVSQRVTRAEHAKVTRWRHECLVEAGYDGSAAAVLADRIDIDLHVAIALVRRGCAPATAVRILV